LNIGLSSGTLVHVNAFTTIAPFDVREAWGQSEPLFVDADALPLEVSLLTRIAELPPGGLLPIDFAHIRIASEAARQLIRRAIIRLSSGELQDRYIVLINLESNRYNLEAMLRTEGLVAVERTKGGPHLIGRVERAAEETFSYAASKRAVTASMVQERFGLQGIAAANNRLTSLWKLALLRRADARSLPGGGREFLFAAVK
jgi:hypothetical protein